MTQPSLHDRLADATVCRFDRAQLQFQFTLTIAPGRPVPADADLSTAWPAPAFPIPTSWEWRFTATRTDTADNGTVEPGRAGAGPVKVELTWKLARATKPVRRRGRPAGAARHGRRVLSPEFLAQVVGVYRAAVVAGVPPLHEICARFGTAHRTAAHWVQRARRAGLLGASLGTKPGERTDSDDTSPLTRNMKVNTP